MTNDAVRRVAAGVKFNVLGPLTVTEGTATLNVGGPKQRTVLAMLVSRAGSPVSADLLVDAVYGDEAGPRSRRTIQTFVSTLRGEVGDVIQKSGGGWRFTADRESIDASAFEGLVAAAKEVTEQSPDRAAQLLREALALWNGHPYSDVEAHGHLDGEVSRLNELRLSAQSSRIDSDLAAGRHGDLVGEIEALLVEHPYQEHFRAQHMLALYRAGRQQEALVSYRQMRGLLADELGIDPSAELQELELRILEQDSSLHETAGSTIQRKAVLVADPGDPLEIARLESSERESVVARAAEVVDNAVGSQPGAISHSAGTATYALFDDTAQAASAAEAVALRLDGEGLRMAIDWGDVEVGEDGVTGPPVTRAARLVGVAHRGQVLLSAEAQHALSAGGGPGLRFETLGSHPLPGLENNTAIYQLLVGDPPVKFTGLATDRLPPPLPGAGHRSVPGYELREPFGRGSIGELYTAYQPSVGRQVLVEVIPRSIASNPDFIRRFEADVQRLWLLDHPNINSIVDYWRDPEGAFVVYRWHRGGLLDIRAPVAEPGALVNQIGSALAYAHSYGLVHGSLAPDRVLLDESGSAYLLGFPIASVPGPPGEYPEYIAPETVDGSAATVESDVYALGMLTLELDQGGRVAADSPVFTNVPALSRALSDEADDRYVSIGEFLRDLAPREADSPDTRFTETRNPYKGLAAFHESDARDFFGRSELTGQLVDRLAEQRFLAVVGPSGSGKSSVVRAGLIPAVRTGRIAGSGAWLVTDMLPGSHPFLELRRALERVAVDMPPGVMDALASERSDALADIGAVLPEGASLLLLVDQFEELFTLVAEETRSRFIDLLSTAVADGHARVVVTLRADFLDRPLAYSELAELFDLRMVTVGSPTEAELREAISSPAAAVGVEVAPDLVERMVHEVHDRPGALPLLQHTLSELFGGRDSDLLAVEAYQAVGGVSGSLGNRAEATYQDLDDDRRTATKQLFLRLVTISDESAPTRRRVRVTSLEDLDAEVALTAFTSARLLVVDSDPDTRTPTVEVAHEALLTHWPRLSGWIESAREDLTLSRRLQESMQEWQRNDRDDAYLLAGARLAQHRTWTSSSSLKLTDEESEYLELSGRRDEKQRAQRRRRRNWITGGFAAAALVASVFGIVALNEANRADDAAADAEAQADAAIHAARTARANELFASAAASLVNDPQLSLLLTLQGVEIARFDSLDTGTLRNALQSEHLIEIADGSWRGVPISAAISDDGNDIFVITDVGELAAFDRSSGDTQALLQLSDDLSLGRNLGVTADGAIVAAVHSLSGEPSSSEAQGLVLVDTGTGAVQGSWTLDDCGAVLMGMSADRSRVALVPSVLTDGVCEHGGEAYVVGLPGLSVVWSGPVDGLELFLGGQNYRQLHYGGSGSHVGWFTPDEVAVIHNIDTDVETRIPLSNEAWNVGMAFSGDGTKVVIGSRPIRVFDIETGEQIVRRPLDAVTSHVFLDDDTVLSVFRDADVEVWDSKTGDLITAITGDGHFPDLSSSPVSAEGLLVLENAARDQVGVVQLDTPNWGAVPVDVCPYSTTARFLTWASLTVRNGRGIITSLCDGVQGAAASVLDIENGAFTGSVGELLSQYVGLSPDGNRMAGFFGTVEQDENDVSVLLPEGIEVFDFSSETRLHLQGTCVKDGSECSGPTPDPEYVRESGPMAWSPDGAMIAGSNPGESWVSVWDAKSGEQLWLREYEFADTPNPAGLAFSPDGSQLWVGSHSDRIDIYDTNTWEVAMTIPPEDGGDIIRFHGDQVLAESVNRTELVVLDITGSVQSRHPFEFAGGENHATTSPNGQLIATNGEDGAVRVRDLETWQMVEEIQVADNKVQGTHWLDNQTILVAVADGRLLEVTLDSGALVDLARQRITRTFTEAECVRYELERCPTLAEWKDD